MVNVTARKIRDHSRDRSSSGAVAISATASAGLGRVYHGLLVSYPSVGRGMVIFRDPNGHRMVTTPVRRILKDPDDETLYVETENSVYRLTFHQREPLAAAC
ncbi:MAG: hypothetical protein JNJ46_26035 [Myxococcales bacterium]|nr:hypothetical protein [Myxococcales bacterium]